MASGSDTLTPAATRAPWSRLRLRQTPHLRDMLAETTFSVAQLVQPVFVVEGLTGSEPIDGLGDDNPRHGLHAALDAMGRDVDAGVRHFLLFAIPSAKAARALQFTHLARTVEAITTRFGDALHLWVDICLCSATSHGHCALLDEMGGIDLGATLDALARSAVDVARAGAGGVSPSDMMDGRTAHIREALDEAGHGRVPIMSYSTKFASHFYGPFRNAADSAPQFGNRRHYQIDVRSRRDAIGSSVRCAAEGADLLMVKPGLTSLDLIAPIAAATGTPVGANQVSGEYAGLLALAERGLTDFDGALAETLHVFRRAGAAFVITYGARRARALGLA
jgi:porphobilinogen synthase